MTYTCCDTVMETNNLVSEAPCVLDYLCCPLDHCLVQGKRMVSISFEIKHVKIGRASQGRGFDHHGVVSLSKTLPSHYWLKQGSRPKMTEKLLTGTLNLNQTHFYHLLKSMEKGPRKSE